MTEGWAALVTPLLVLPLVLLFRFMGCGLNVKGTLEQRLDGGRRG